MFTMFSQNVRGFRKFLKFSDLLGPVRTCSDAFRCVWARSEAFGRFQKISNFLRKRRAEICFFSFFKGFLDSISVYFRSNLLAELFPSTVLCHLASRNWIKINSDIYSNRNWCEKCFENVVLEAGWHGKLFEMKVWVAAIVSDKFSFNSELSSRFFGRL